MKVISIGLNHLLVPLLGAQIPALSDGASEWIPISFICTILGLSIDKEQHRLATAPWATVKTLDEHGVCVGAGALPIWVASVDVEDVTKAKRDAFVAFQAEAASIIAAFWPDALSALPKGVKVVHAVPNGPAPQAEVRKALDGFGQLEPMPIRTVRVEPHIRRIVNAAARRSQDGTKLSNHSAVVIVFYDAEEDHAVGGVIHRDRLQYFLRKIEQGPAWEAQCMELVASERRAGTPFVFIASDGCTVGQVGDLPS